MLCGSKFNRPANKGGIWAFKTDGRGRFAWQKMIEDPTAKGAEEDGRCIIRAHDIGYVIAGDFQELYDPPFAWFNSAWLLKIDEAGELVWPARVFGETYRDETAWCVAATPDGGYIVAGGQDAAGTDRMNGWLVATKTWAASPAVTRTDLPNGVTRTLDGGYLIVGWSSVPEPSGYYGGREVTLIKTGPDGETHWLEYLPGTYGANKVGYAALALEDGSYVILACKLPETEPRSTTPVWLFRLAPNLPPTALMDQTPSGTVPGVPVQFSGERPVDHDGSITQHERAFGDGAVATGGRVEHAFAGVGTFPVTLTVVDNDDGEQAVTNLVPVAGIVARTAGARIGFAEATARALNGPRCLTDCLDSLMGGGGRWRCDDGRRSA